MRISFGGRRAVDAAGVQAHARGERKWKAGEKAEPTIITGGGPADQQQSKTTTTGGSGGGVEGAGAARARAPDHTRTRDHVADGRAVGRARRARNSPLQLRQKPSERKWRLRRGAAAREAARQQRQSGKGRAARGRGRRAIGATSGRARARRGIRTAGSIVGGWRLAGILVSGERAGAEGGVQA